MSPFEASEIVSAPHLGELPEAKAPKSDRWGVAGAQLAIVAVFVGLWQLAVVRGWITEFFFGKPSEVFRYLFARTMDGYLIDHTWVTLYEELLGFGAGTFVGRRRDCRSGGRPSCPACSSPSPSSSTPRRRS
jgi:hypothetical protein